MTTCPHTEEDWANIKDCQDLGIDTTIKLAAKHTMIAPNHAYRHVYVSELEPQLQAHVNDVDIFQSKLDGDTKVAATLGVFGTTSLVTALRLRLVQSPKFKAEINIPMDVPIPNPKFAGDNFAGVNTTIRMFLDKLSPARLPSEAGL
jgi:hypothetical protein